MTVPTSIVPSPEAEPVQPNAQLSIQQQAALGAAASQAAGFSSMADLKAKNPELYKLIERSIADTIIQGMRKHEKRIKELNRESRA